MKNVILEKARSAYQTVAVRFGLPLPGDPSMEAMVMSLKKVGYDYYSGSSLGGPLTSLITPGGKMYFWDGYPGRAPYSVGNVLGGDLLGGSYKATVRRFYRRAVVAPKAPV